MGSGDQASGASIPDTLLERGRPPSKPPLILDIGRSRERQREVVREPPTGLPSRRHSRRCGGSNLAVEATFPALLPRLAPLPALPLRRIAGGACCSHSVAGTNARGGTTGGGGTGGEGKPGRPGDCKSASASACSILARPSKQKLPFTGVSGGARTTRTQLGPKSKSFGLLPGGQAIRSFSKKS
jgi:hypothetical protein